MWLRQRGRFRRALPLLQRAVTQSKASARPHVVASLSNNLGLIYKDVGEYDAAARAYRDALALCLPDRGWSNDLATLCHNLGGINHARGSYDKAERFARLGIRIRMRIRKSTARALARDVVALAAILHARGKYVDAEQEYLRGIRLLSGSPRRDYELAVAQGGLAALYVDAARLEDAAALMQQCLITKQKCFGTSHPDYLLTLNNFGVLQWKRGNRDAARQILHETARAFNVCLGPTHPRTIAARDQLHIANVC